MRLKSLTLKGFKSFPDRTHMDFGPGVSVVVGPNGSGKSNVTDAVLWAMGEQSPLAVRGQSMQDVIFGGGHGVQARSAAEVEIVLDNSDGTVDLPLSEISIVRRLERNGEGGYRLNGARARLTDVIEVLSDTGLGKETHSVISQGRVEAIVTSKARDRRLLIEEAAGLGKHRKRRRRAQLKLERTQENLDRALDVEREARTRLRPLKRQAEAAELHERLERQSLEVRWELARDAAKACRVELAAAEAQVAQTRGAREQIEAGLQETVQRRGLAERALSERAERHEQLSRRVYAARSAHERLGLRGEQAAAAAQTLARRVERLERELAELEARSAQADATGDMPAGEGRIAALEAELSQIAARREQELGVEVAELEQELERQRRQVEQVAESLATARSAREHADAEAAAARERLMAAERSVEQARRESARIGAELAAANQFLRGHAAVRGAGAEGAKALSEDLRVGDGYELALAAALGGRLDAAVVEDVAGAESLLDRVGPDGGTALLTAAASASGRGGTGVEGAHPQLTMPAGAERLLDLLSGPPEVLALARRLLSDAWVVERLEDLPSDFGGIAVTRAGRVWFAAWGEVRQLSEGGTERVLARRNERDRLIAATEQAAQGEQAVQGAHEQALGALQTLEQAGAAVEEELRACERRGTEAGEAVRRSQWLIEQRRAAPAEGPLAVRKAELEGELASERSHAERMARETLELQGRIATLRAQLQADTALLPRAERLSAALGVVAEAVQERFAGLEQELSADRAAGEEMASELRSCAAQEAEIQAALRSAGEAVTAAEVAAQRLRDQAGDAELECKTVAERLGLEQVASEQAASDEGEAQAPARLEQEQLDALRARLERLSRRREQLGPVNPLAQEEYSEALAHVEEMEGRRADLETALRELRGVIRDTDRQIQETFQETFDAAARNFEELVGDVFPGGSGRLRLVSEEQPPRGVLGGASLGESGAKAKGTGLGGAAATAEDTGGEDAEAAEAAAEQEANREELREEDLLGVEIEITPAGKSSKRLSLLSGGEKSMTALAFLFAVFLARPCPFYILDEVEAALDDLNLDRFLALLRRYAGRAQFIVITHQKRTMEAADWLFGVSMGGDGVSKVLSRRLPAERAQAADDAGATAEIAGVAEVA
ncbi:MAG TPA: AAA family ATPase [Solirubrobacteraceae bacterium]|jgi:chromosome segregation protein|nr:AAA family ATPase [Solirubrobacteraceae bacterium]